jgi:hypothetical protein
MERSLVRFDGKRITSPAYQTKSVEQPSKKDISIALRARRRVLFETHTEHRSERADDG